MFHRITVEQWQSAMSIAAMMLFLGSFLFALLKIFAMRKDQISHIEQLPLESDHTDHEDRD